MRRIRSLTRVLLFLGIPLSMTACDGGETQSSGGGGASGTTSDTGGQPAWKCGDPETFDPPPASYCERLPPGPKGARSVPVDLSAAHARVRFFGPVTKYSDADQALASALQGEDAWSGKDLSAYTNALPGVACSRSAEAVPSLSPATVTLVDGVAVVRPGTGPVTLPEGTAAVLVDLRDLPWTEGLRGAILAAVSQALATPVTGPVSLVRQHQGMTDEVQSPENAYSNKVATQPAETIEAAGTADLPLAFATGARMAPDAVEIAATLRIVGRARIIGESLRIEVAESSFHGVGDSGVAVRDKELHRTGKRYPDSIDPDVRTAHPECHTAEIRSADPLPAALASAADRPLLKAVAAYGKTQPKGNSLGEARAALVIAHGATRLFFPYFDVVGDDIDPRLEETTAALPKEPTRGDIRDALRRFGEALSDGHVFVLDWADGPSLTLPLRIEHVDGAPVVRRSGAPQIEPGDTITSIGGVPAEDYYAAQIPLTSAASAQYKLAKVSNEYMQSDSPVELGLVSANGASKTVLVEPKASNPVHDATGRTAGPLADKGAPDLYYINMDQSVGTSLAVVKAALAEAETANAKGLVIDMRGYPAINHYEVAQRLVLSKLWSPRFGVPVWSGPGESTVKESYFNLPTLSSPAYHGPIALIVGNQSVSAAENFSIMLLDAKRAHVFGRRSAATNGNITGLHLPGRFAFFYTGMRVRFGDESTFHGVGIVPEVESVLTAQAFANGEDPELDDAIAWLSMQ